MPLKDQMATGKLHEKVAGRELGEFVISKVEEVIFNKCFLTGMPGGKQQPPRRHDDWAQGRQHPTQMHTRGTHGYCRGLQAASRLGRPHPTAPVWSFLRDNADREKQSVQWPH